MLNYARLVGSGLLAGIVAALGGWDKALEALVVFMTLDYAAAVALAIRDKRVSSAAGARGIFRKVGLLVAVAFAFAADRYLGLAAQPYIRTAVAAWLTINEAASAAANLALLGVPLPTWLTDALTQEMQRKQPAPAAGGVTPLQRFAIPQNVSDFIARMLEPAKRVEAQTGIPAGIVISQAALESGWGANTLTQQFNNPWAVKFPMTKGVPKAYLPGNDYFAKYASLDQAADDYAKFVQPTYNSRYAQAWSVRTDPEAYIREISKAGYEDGQIKSQPGPYANQIIDIFHSFGLDTLGGSSAPVPAPSPAPVPPTPQQPAPIPSPAPAMGPAMDLQQLAPWVPGIAIVLILLASVLLSVQPAAEV